MVNLSPPLDPPVLKGIKVYPDDPFKFDFILDRGDSDSSDISGQASRLIKYFLASLTIPEKDLWVNLSPYEKDRIIPPSFGRTQMGRDLLAEDYLLKQITASLIYPEGETGKKFWKRVYQQAREKYGTTDIAVNTFNKVWILPQQAVVYENAQAGTAYIIQSRLKVMLEQDYLSLAKHEGSNAPAQVKGTSQLGSQIIREIVIPELTREVNEDKNFAPLRQVYNSLILATWYKMKIKNSILTQVYADKNKVAGVGFKGPLRVQVIYKRYLQAFKKGVYNYVKEEEDPLTRQIVPKKYFSGGVTFNLAVMAHKVIRYTHQVPDAAMAASKTFKVIGVSLAVIGALGTGAWYEMSHYQPAPNMVLMNLSTGQKFVGHEISERTAVIEATRGEFWTDAVEMQDCVIAVVIDERGKMSIAHFFNEDVADLNHQVVNFLGRLSVKPKLVNLIHSHSEILSYVKSAFAAQGISNNAINVSLAGNHNFYFGIKQENGKIEATAADNTQFGGFAVTHEDFIPRNEGHGVIKLVSQDRAMKSYGEQDRAADFSPPVVRRVAQMGQKSGPRNPLRIVLAGTGLREVKYTIQMLEGIEQNSPKLMFANIMAYSKSQETVQKIDENLRAVRKTGWKIELQAKDLLDTDSSLGQGDQDVIVSQNSFYLSRGLDTADKLFAEKQKEFVAKVARALRPGGIFVIEDSGAQDGDLSFIEQAGFRLLRFRGPMSQLVFERVDRAMNALSILKSYYEGALRENPKAAAYLKRRNIDPETLDHAIEETGKDVLREKLKDPKHPLIAFAGGTQSKVYRGMVEGNDIIVKNIKDPQAWSKYKEYQDRLGHNGFALVAGYLVFKDLKIYVDGRIVRIPHAVVQEEVVPLLDRVRTLRKTYQGSPEVLHREIDNLLNDYFELYKRLLSQGLVMKPDGFLVDTGLTKDNRVVVLDGGDLLTRQEASQEYDLENFNRSFIQALKADTIFVRYTPDGKKAEPVDTVAELGSTLDSFNFSVVQSANRDLSNGKALELLAQRPEIKRELYFGNYKIRKEIEGARLALINRRLSQQTPSGSSDKAMKTPASKEYGGIDLTASQMNLQTQNSGQDIKFHLDAAQLARLQNASGLEPVIANIRPLRDLAAFLGVDLAQ